MRKLLTLHKGKLKITKYHFTTIRIAKTQICNKFQKEYSETGLSQIAGGNVK